MVGCGVLKSIMVSTKIELRANPATGYAEWQCPECGHLHGPKAINQTGSVRCYFKECMKSFRFGVAITGGNWAEAFFLGPTTGEIVNCADDTFISQMRRVAGRVYGNLKWACPECDTYQHSNVKYKDGSVECSKCRTVFIVHLLIWKCAKGNRHAIPFDWS